jgi:hypothetical protein
MVSEKILPGVRLMYFEYFIENKGNLKNIIIPIKKWINTTKKNKQSCVSIF